MIFFSLVEVPVTNFFLLICITGFTMGLACILAWHDNERRYRESKRIILTYLNEHGQMQKSELLRRLREAKLEDASASDHIKRSIQEGLIIPRRTKHRTVRYLNITNRGKRELASSTPHTA